MLSRVLRTIWVAALMGGLWYGHPLSAHSQEAGPVGAPTYTAGATTNLFAAPNGSGRVDGWVVQLPTGWTVDGVTVLRYGSERVAAAVQVVEEASPNTHAIVLDRRQQGPHEIIVKATVGAVEGAQSWSLVPFTYEPMGYRSMRDGQRITRDVKVRAASSEDAAGAHRALAFASDEPLLLRAEALPAFTADADFTVELWLKTTGLDEVVLSAWTGDEREAYPLEIMVDASGRLRYYCGQQGRHESLTTRAPVADGRWHHLAIVHRAAQQRIVLLREGQPVDSLQHVALPTRPPSRVAVGGRVPSSNAAGRDDGTSSLAYTGQMDELRLWATARSATALRSTARRALTSVPSSDLVQFRFEEDPPSEVIEQWPQGVRRVASSLSLNAPLQNLQATVENGTVHLDWEANDPETDVFIVERSIEGQPFQPVGRVRPRRTEAGDVRHMFSDTKVTGQVVYYRIRQRFQNGSERISGTLKIGLGAPDQRGASLIGNFPNPFSAGTTIAYEVRTTQRVQLTIWDLSGQQVTTLVDDTRTPGYYEEPFQTNNLPSGTYFVRLQTPSETASHRMVVLK